MAKAVMSINKITPFDATEDYEITFTYSGGAQAYYNKLIVRNASSGEAVYTDTVQTMQYSHTIPASTLTNGTTYNATIEVYNMGDGSTETMPSSTSEKQCEKTISFKCFSTPTFKLNTFPSESGNIVSSSSFVVDLTYSQAEGEPLQCYNYILYNSSKYAIYTSDAIYDVTTFDEVVSGLEDNAVYFIVVNGLTLNGISLTTDYIPFTCDYLDPATYSLITLENEEDVSGVLIKSNMTDVEGEAESDPVFLEGTYVDLRDNAVTYSSGFNITKSYTIIGSGYNFTRNSIICTIETDSGTINLYYRIAAFESSGSVEQAYIELRIENDLTTYTIMSNLIDIPESTDILAWCIRREDTVYDVRLKNIAEVN